MAEPIRVVFTPDVGDEEVSFVAGTEGWIVQSSRGPDEQSFERTWVTDDGTTVSYVEDYGLGIHYAVVEGPSVNAVVEKLRATLRVLNREQVLSLYENARTDEQKVLALYYAGAAATSKYDSGLAAGLQRGMADASEQVRSAAAYACAYAAWRELEAPLEQLAANDSSEGVRELAASVLRSLRQVVWKERN